VKHSPYYFEIKDIINQFVAAFDDVTIKRFNKDRSPENQLQVRYLYSPKQRTLHNIVNKAEHITLPAISISISGIKRDLNRVWNKNFGIYLKNSKDVKYIKQPIPINISLNMSIIARYSSDIDQIISNFAPYNNPYIVISWPIPEELVGSFPDKEIRSHVHWNEDISYEYPNEINDNSQYRLIVNTGFQIEGWLFKDIQNDTSPIYYIDANFYSVSSFDVEEM
jgi:hypothetical protein